jgi:hypothetical protein
MATSRTPGFTAEASLYRARRSYRAARGRPARVGVLPAQLESWRQSEDCVCVRWICNANPNGCVCVRWICDLD